MAIIMRLKLRRKRGADDASQVCNRHTVVRGCRRNGHNRHVNKVGAAIYRFRYIYCSELQEFSFLANIEIGEINSEVVFCARQRFQPNFAMLSPNGVDSINSRVWVRSDYSSKKDQGTAP